MNARKWLTEFLGAETTFTLVQISHRPILSQFTFATCSTGPTTDGYDH